MGPLAGGRVYLDTNSLIYAFEQFDTFPGLIDHLLVPLQSGDLTVVTSTITLAEVLTHPIKNGDQALATAYRDFLMPTKHLELWPVDAAIADRAAQLRVAHKLRTPDAIHLATCIAAKCTILLSRDVGFSGLGIRVISPDRL